MEGRTSALQPLLRGFSPGHYNKRVGRTGQPTRLEGRLRLLLQLLLHLEVGPLLLEVHGAKEDRAEDWARPISTFARLNWQWYYSIVGSPQCLGYLNKFL